MNARTWVLTVSLAVWGLGYLLGQYPPQGLWEVAFWAGVVFLLSLMDVPLPLAGRVTMGFVGALGASTVLFPNWAFVVGVLGYWAPRPVWYKEVFNRLQLGVSAGTASYIYFSFPPPWSFPLAAAAYFLVNLLSVLLLFWGLGMDPKHLWRRQYRHFTLAYLGLSPLAFLVGELYRTLGVWSVLVVLVPVVYAWQMWRHQVRLLQAVNAVINSLVSLLEARDAYTARHSQRVAAIASDIARELGLSPEELELVEKAALLHDIGKVGVPDAVLGKASGLSREEWNLMRSHPLMGEALLSPLFAYLGGIGPGVRHHHERWDGRGYPDGLAGLEIPLLARIIAVADAYEAMTSDRPYRRGKSPEEALREIKDLSGIQFDPKVVAAFERVWSKDPSWKRRERFLTLV